jgi:hypothetical protein
MHCVPLCYRHFVMPCVPLCYRHFVMHCCLFSGCAASGVVRCDAQSNLWEMLLQSEELLHSKSQHGSWPSAPTAHVWQVPEHGCQQQLCQHAERLTHFSHQRGMMMVRFHKSFNSLFLVVMAFLQCPDIIIVLLALSSKFENVQRSVFSH